MTRSIDRIDKGVNGPQPTHGMQYLGGLSLREKGEIEGVCPCRKISVKENMAKRA